MAREEDERDVEAVLAGDVDRFEGIVARWGRPLVNLAYRFVRNEGTAEEMAQDAMLKCFRSLHQWRRDGKFSTWLFALAMNVYRSHLRRFYPEITDEEALRTLTIPAPQENLGEEQRHEAVRRAVSLLPLLYREPLVLFYFAGEDVAEVARILAIPAGTVKARLHRGRELLRERLQKWMN
jgi:RNA polymerase sigma-70 factor (ECF subfamily)